MSKKIFALFVLLMAATTMSAMQIFVRTQSAKNITLDVEPTHLIRQIKEMIYEKEGILVGDQCLLFAGETLQDDKTIADYNIQNKSTLNVLVGKYDLVAGTSEHGTMTFKIGSNVVSKANEGDVVTLVITPAEGWAVGMIKGEWSMAWEGAKAPRRAQNLDLLKDFELTPVDNEENTYTFTMKRGNAEVSANYRKLLTNKDITISSISAVTYNGQAQTPAVTVKDGSTILTKDVDYSVNYTDNLNAGQATITFIGKGDYAGQVVKNFTIDRANITPIAPTATGLTYNGAAQTLINAGAAEGGEMQYSLDGQTYASALPQGTNAGSYTIFYKVVADANHNDVDVKFVNVPIYKAALTTVLLSESNLVYNKLEQSPVISGVKAGTLQVASADYTLSGSATNVGTYTITATAKDNAQNFTGQTTAQYSIVAADANLFALTLGNSSFVYNGEEKKPSVTVKDGDAVLVEGKDYTLAYTNNVNVGTATVTATGKGNYSGTKTAQFTITKADIILTAPTANTELIYTTQPQALIAVGNAQGGEMQYSLDGTSWNTNIPTGTDAKEYTVYYRVVADANHNDVAAQSFKVTIEQAKLTAATLTETTFIYNQKEQTAQVAIISAGAITVPSEGYEIADNKATNVGNYTATITGKGNYKGSMTANFSIVAANANLFNLTLGTAEYIYDGSEKKPTVTVKDGDAVLVEGTDYTLAYTANVNAGTATVTATGIGNYSGTKTATFTIKTADITPTAPTAMTNLVFNALPQTLIAAGSVQGGEMQYSLDGMNYSTSLPSGFDAKEYTVYYKVVADANHNDVAAQNFKVTIAQAELTELILAQTQLTYNQKEQTVGVAGVRAGDLPVAADSYDVSGNKATIVGEYTVTVTGKGNFKNTATAKFVIVSAEAEAKFEMTLTVSEYIYDGTAKTPAVTVKDGDAVLVEGTDYTLAYTANVNAGTATVTATGIGNYSGTKTASFTIKPATLTSVTLSQTEFQYNLFEPVEQNVSIAEVKAGNLVVPANQYEVEGNTQTEPGTYTVTVTGKTNFIGEVKAEFTITEQVVAGNAEETETGDEVENVMMTVSVVDRENQTLSIDRITEPSVALGENITLEIPAQINGWDVVGIDESAMSGMENVTDVYMPETEKPIFVSSKSIPATATIHTPLALLDDYALMASLKENYEAAKVVTTVTPANKFWTLGIGCDVVVPDGIDVYAVKVKNSAEVATEIVPDELLMIGSERVIKANNGVLLLGEAGKTYNLVAYSGRLASGMPVASSDNKDYGRSNCLEPVVEKKHYESGHYFVLQNNEFHSILVEGDEVKVPAGKAVLHLGNEQAGANARVLTISGDVTGVNGVKGVMEVKDDSFFNLQGRRVLNAQKGLYIQNGRIVVVK